MTPEDRRRYNIEQTYLALRIAMIMLMALLFVTIALQFSLVNDWNCWQTSISAYYFTSVRPVFIGALCAIGAGMIIYRGNNPYENIALDYTGFMAFIVAFVPTSVDKACQPTNGPGTPEIEVAVQTNVGALLAIGVIATVVGFIVRKSPPEQTEKTAKIRWSAALSVGLTLLALSIGTYLYAYERPWFLKYGHICAAVLLFVGIVTVVGVNVWKAPQGRFTALYWAVAGLMGLSVIAGGILWLTGRAHWALWLEALIIFSYGVFWIVQTAELGGEVKRPEVEPDRV